MIAAEEFKEDVKENDYVRIDTQTGQLVGRVTRIRTTSIKLDVAGKEQAVSFDTMLRYTSLDAAEAGTPAGAAQQETVQGAQQAAAAPAQDAAVSALAKKLAPYWQAAEDARFVPGDRAHWKKLKKAISEHDHTKETSILSQFDYAIKVHEDTAGADRMHDIQAAARRVTLAHPDNRSAQYLLGLLHDHVREDAAAARAYGLAGAYEAACASAAQAGEEELLARYALLAAVRQGSLAAFRHLAGKPQLFFAAAHELLAHPEALADEAARRAAVGAIAYQAARAGSLASFETDDVLGAENLAALRAAVDGMDRDEQALASSQAELATEQEETRAKGKRILASVSSASGLPEREYQEGVVSFFNVEKCIGALRSKQSPSIFFHINQVSDRGLREALLHGQNMMKVTFCLGSNRKTLTTGEPAGDDIRPAENVAAEAPAMSDETEGVVVWYNRMEGNGVVRLDDGTVRGFIDRNISDRRLLEYLRSYYAEGGEWPVHFHLLRKGEKEHAEKVVSAAPFPEDVETEWRISKTFEHEEKPEAAPAAPAPVPVRTPEEEAAILDRPFAPLAPFHPQEGQLAPRPVVRPAAPALFRPQPAPASAPVRTPSWTGTFEISWTRAEGAYLSNYTKAHQILFRRDPSLAQLERAEQYCIEALKRGENVEGTVGDLLHLYLRKSKVDGRPEEDYDKAFALMEKAKPHLPHDKYVQQMINLLAASGRDPEQLIALYEENINDFIPTGRKLHFLMQKAGLEFRLEQYDAVMSSCRRWRNIAQTSVQKPNDIAYHSIDRYEAMALYLLGRVAEAQEKARQAEEYFPQDEALAHIVRGDWNPQATRKADYNIVNPFEILQSPLPAYIEDYLNGLSLSDMKETRYVKDTGIVDPETDTKMLDREFEQIEKHGMSVVAKEKAKWQFLQAKYILICLASWQKIHGEPLSTMKFSEAALKRAVLRGLNSLIRAECEKTKEEPQLDTIRFYYCLSLEIRHEFQNDAKEMEHEICGYVYTDFYPAAKIAAMEGKDLTLDRMIAKMATEKPLHASLRRIRINLTQLLNQIQPYARQEKERIEGIFFGSEAFKENGESDADVEQAFHEEARAQKHLSEQFPAPIAQKRENFGSLSSLRQLRTYFEDQKPHMTEQDQSYCEQMLGDIFPDLERTCAALPFETHANFLESIETNADALQKKIAEAPTQFSYEKLLPMLKLVGDYAREDKKRLYQKTPSITAEIFEHNRKEDGSVSVTMKISNQADCQPADNATVVIKLGDEPGGRIVYRDDDKPQVLQDDLSIQFDLPADVLATLDGGALQTVDLTTTVAYQYKVYGEDGEIVIERGAFDDSEPLPLGDMKDFERIPNPYSRYTKGKAVDEPEMVFGREEVFRRIIGMIEGPDGALMPGRAIVLYGQKRSGKSTVLVQLQKRIARHFRQDAICINLGSIGIDVTREENPRQFLANFLSTVASKLDVFVDDEIYEDFTQMMYDADIVCPSDTLPTSPNPTGEFSAYLTAYLKVLKRWNPRANIVFFLDEFTWLYQFIKEGSADPSFLRFWKAFTETYHCLSILVGQNHMPQFIKEFPNDFGADEKVVITYIDKESAAQMIREPLWSVAPAAKIDDDAIDRMYEASGGSVYYQMLFCSWLVEYMNERCVYRVTKGVVEAMLSKAIEARLIQEEDIFQPLVADPVDEPLLKELLISLARNDENAKGIPAERFANETEMLRSRKSELLERLCGRDVLKREKSLYTIRIGFVHQWIVQSYGGK